MRKLILALGATAVVAMSPVGISSAEARPHHAKRVYKECRKSSGTTGLIAGGATGALVGHALLGGPVGIAAGAVGGAFAGRGVDRAMTAKKRCHYYTRG